jgi:hypothetical protein
MRTLECVFNKIQTIVFRVFLTVVHIHLYIFLPSDFYFFKLTQPFTVSVKEKEENVIENHTPFLMV